MHIPIGLRTVVAKSCCMCHVLKTASEFSKTASGYLDSYCRPCHSVHGRAGIKAHQQAALKAAVKHRQPWSVREIRELEDMLSGGLSGPQIALRLNRSLYAIYSMRQKLAKEDE